MNEAMAEMDNDRWARETLFDTSECGGPHGCGEPLDGESAEYVTAPGETATMHAQCGVDAGLSQA